MYFAAEGTEMREADVTLNLLLSRWCHQTESLPRWKRKQKILYRNSEMRNTISDLTMLSCAHQDTTCATRTSWLVLSPSQVPVSRHRRTAELLCRPECTGGGLNIQCHQGIAISNVHQAWESSVWHWGLKPFSKQGQKYDYTILNASIQFGLILLQQVLSRTTE